MFHSWWNPYPIIPSETSKWGIKTAVDFSTRATRKYHPGGIFTLTRPCSACSTLYDWYKSYVTEETPKINQSECRIFHPAEGRFYRGIDKSCTLWKEVCAYLIFILYNLVAVLKHVCFSANQNVGFCQRSWQSGVVCAQAKGEGKTTKHRRSKTTQHQGQHRCRKQTTIHHK